MPGDTPASPAPAVDPRYPGIDDLRERARRRIPRFAFEYLDGGCNEEVNLARNTSDIREIELQPRYLTEHAGVNLETELFGHVYAAPFGVAPIGLQGLVWPKAPEILARAASRANVPFILSTVSTSSIETISEVSEGRAWFQLYHPTEDALRDDLLARAEAAQCPVLVVLCDVPSFGYRHKDIRNGLSLPPKMTARNVLQMAGRPGWALGTLAAGRPGFATMERYMPAGLDLAQLGDYMDETFSGRLNEAKIGKVRDRWKGKLVLKGVASEEDAETAVRLGFDGIIVSNHGGRQLDAGESAIKPLTRIAARYGDATTVMMDSGIRSGPDIARVLARGARFTFLGRSFMYGVAALGDRGGDHTIEILHRQLQQVLEQLSCERVTDLPRTLPAPT